MKRNVVESDSPSTLLNAVPGWTFNESTQQYQTTIYVSSPDGHYLDLGDTSAYINGSLLSGEVFLPQGYTVFATSDANWLQADETVSNADDLEAADPLYPYNHKYLVEGYPYADDFSGERLYTGVSDFFGAKLLYRSPEEFAYMESSDPNFYNVFTVDDSVGKGYIKVKVDKSDASWLSERFDLDWSVQTATSNELYVKALLSTSNKAKSPRVDSFKVRVI